MEVPNSIFGKLRSSRRRHAYSMTGTVWRRWRARRVERLARLRRRCSKMAARMNETKTTMATVTAIEDAPISNGEDRPKKSERVPPMNSNMAAIIATQAYRYLNDVLA